MSKISPIICAVILVAVAAGGAMVYANGGSNVENTIEVTDMLGEKTEVVKNPEHVACVSRTTYDLLVAFGLGDRIDGVYSTLLDNPWTSVLYPDSSEHFAYAYEPSHDLLLERHVDLVLSPEKYITDGLKEHGIAALTVCLYGNPDFEPYVYFLADLAGTLWPDIAGIKEKADAWKAKFGSVIEEVETTLSGKSLEEKTVYYIRGDKNKGICYTDTGFSFNEYAFKLLRMKFLGSTFGTNKPSADALLAADPDIIVIGGIYQHTLRNALTTEVTWSTMSAVSENTIYQIGTGFSPMEQIGVFSPVFLADMANKLYPAYFDYDVETMLTEMCQDYFGVTLTSQQAQNMLKGLGPDGNPMA